MCMFFVVVIVVVVVLINELVNVCTCVVFCREIEGRTVSKEFLGREETRQDKDGCC